MLAAIVHISQARVVHCPLTVVTTAKGNPQANVTIDSLSHYDRIDVQTAPMAF